MDILIAIVAALSATAFWYYRLRPIGQVTHEAVDGAQTLVGTVRRRRFQIPVESSPFLAVQDPGTAAAMMLVALATMEGALTQAAEDAIKAELRTILNPADCDETFSFACWLAGQANDANDVSLRFSKLWTASLTLDERLHFYAMAKKVTAIGGVPDDARGQTLARLKDRLGLFRV